MPPLNSIKAFEAAARLGGVRLAAQDLNVSQSTVSHHIANLEGFLNVKLFDRRGIRVILTEIGREYLQQIEPALDAIRRASENAASLQPRRRLVVSAPPTFTANWIMPRLSRFWNNHPKLDLRFVSQMTLPEDDTTIDYAIEYRFEPSPRLQSEALIPEDIVVLAAPEYVARYAIKTFEDIEGCTLIDTDRRLVSWQDVLKPYAWGARQRMLAVSQSSHAFEAARIGLGLALGNRFNAASLLQQGDLVAPFSLDMTHLPQAPRYFLSHSATQRNSETAEQFGAWVRAEIAAMTA